MKPQNVSTTAVTRNDIFVSYHVGCWVIFPDWNQYFELKN